MAFEVRLLGSVEALVDGHSLALARFTPDGARLFVLSDPESSRLRRAIRWEVDPELWLQRACAVAGGGLTPEQWEEAVPEQDYVSACPSG